MIGTVAAIGIAATAIRAVAGRAAWAMPSAAISPASHRPPGHPAISPRIHGRTVAISGAVIRAGAVMPAPAMALAMIDPRAGIAAAWGAAWARALPPAWARRLRRHSGPCRPRRSHGKCPHRRRRDQRRLMKNAIRATLIGRRPTRIDGGGSAICPPGKGRCLQPGNMGARRRPGPISRGIAAPHPPALAGQAIRFAHHQHGQFRLPGAAALRVNRIEQAAQTAHLGPAEAIAQRQQQFGIGKIAACPRRRDQQGPHVGQIICHHHRCQQ